MNLQFAIDKAAAAIYEGIAIEKIEEWYRQQGKKVHARYNEANGLEEKRGFDLIDTYGIRWECKCDKIAVHSGRIFASESLRTRSKADMVIYLISPGCWILPRTELLALPVSGSDDVGDGNSEHGDYIDLHTFQKASELI
jgi:hypothetical protein